MNQEVTDYIHKVPDWQIAICESLRTMIHETIPQVEERLQYGKPHYLKNGKYAAVIHAGKDKISFMLFNASELDEKKEFLRSMGNGERKTIDITEGQDVDYTQIAQLLSQTSKSL